MNWIGNKLVYPSPETKNAEGQVEWTQEGGLTLFQYTVVQLCKGMMPGMVGRYEEDSLADLAIKQAVALLDKMEEAEEKINVLGPRGLLDD